MRVLIPDAESGHALAVIQSLLLCKGIEIVSLASHKRNAARFVRNIVACDIVQRCSNDRENIESFLQAAKKYSVDIIMPVGELVTGIFAQHSDRVGRITNMVPIPSYRAFQIATDKSRLAEFCLERGIPHPRTYSVPQFRHKVENNPSGAGFPFIVKPARGEGGKGIQLIGDQAKFVEIDFESRERVYGKMVVQEFIDGYDIDLSLLAFDGEILAYTIQKGILGRKSRFAASGGVEFLSCPALFEAASAVTQALKYSGVAHLDFRCDQRDGRYKLVDMNSRFWGSLLGSTKAGVNFPWLACQVGLGKGIDFRGFDENRYFDFLSAARDPFSALGFKVTRRETNLDFWIRAPLANLANTLYRRSSTRSA